MCPMSTPPTLECLEHMLAPRLTPPAADWLGRARKEVGTGTDPGRFCALIALASRHARRVPLAPDSQERARAGAALEGWNPGWWTLLDALRVVLVLSRPDLDGDGGEQAIEEVLRTADEGEACALYRSLAHLPSPERFVARAGEGCRTNMRSVFDACALDTPYPEQCFSEESYRQMVIKSVFVGAPLWRMWGLDGRVDQDLARMALDLAEERRSAGREVQPDLWLCLGVHGGERGLSALVDEMDSANAHREGRAAAAVALARAGETDRIQEVVELEADVLVREAMQRALAGDVSSRTFRSFDPEEADAS